MDARQQKGLEIAATLNITPKGDSWIVPSQTLVGRYTVTRGNDGLECSCPDFELRHSICKHGYAVEFFLKRETMTAPNGETTVTETRAMRVTYPQNWPAYNAAQCAEKELFCHLLRDLCSTVPEPERSMGRPSVPLSEALFSACFKIYSGMSARRRLRYETWYAVHLAVYAGTSAGAVVHTHGVASTALSMVVAEVRSSQRPGSVSLPGSVCL
jgi:hypothetical protein